MLDMSDEIRKCYAHAENCACRAREATTDEERADFLQLERNWLKLAHSYEAVAVEFGLGRLIAVGAESCACKAREATTEEARANLLQLEWNWLKPQLIDGNYPSSRLASRPFPEKPQPRSF